MTPSFVKFGVEPDFFFMPYPEKTRTNSLQYMFMQALSCNFDLKKYLKNKYIDEWVSFRDRFGEYADIWRIEYPHKRYRIKNNIVLENSPLSLLKKFPNMGLITYDVAYEADGIAEVNLPNKNTLFLELQEFADSCKNKKKYRIKNSEAAHNVKVMEAIVKSSKTNRKIFLS